MNTSKLLLATATVALGVSSAQAALFDFATDQLSNFTANNTSGSPASLAYSGTAGVNGGGGLIVGNSNGGPTLVNNTSFSISAGQGYRLSQFFQVESFSETAFGDRLGVAGLGIVSGTQATLNSTAASAFDGVAVRLQTVNLSSPGTLQWNTRTFSNSTGGTNGTPFGTAFNLVEGNWYKMEVTFTKTATTDQWSVTGSLVDYGTDGTTAVSTLTSFGATTITGNNALYTDTTLFAAFNARDTTSSNLNRLQSWDNIELTAVPEPSAFAALAGLGALGFVATRRRRRA